MNDGSTQARLLSRIRHQQSAHLPRRDPSRPVPLSSAQRGLWFLDRLEPGRSDYVVPIALRLTGELDVAALMRALTRLVARHEVLRTRFAVDESGQPYQVIDPPRPATVTVVDMAGQDQAAVRARVDAAAAEPFDLVTGPLLRTLVLRTGPAEATVVICVHHIVFDGWSEAIFARELRQLYAGAEPPELPVQYGDYAAWQEQQLATHRMRGQLEYWRTNLAGLQPLRLPTDRPRQANRSTHGDMVRFTVPAATVTALRDIAARADATLFMALLTAYQVLLSRYTGQTDIAVGTPTAGRNHTETEGLVGLFVNSLVLRTDLSGDPSYADLLERVRDTTLTAYDHQDLPFDRIVEELAPQRDVTRNPIFQATFVLRSAADAQPWQLPGVTVEPAVVSGGLGKFDLNITLRETDDGSLAGHIDYPTDLFDGETVECLAGHFRVLLGEFVCHPTVPLSGVTMLGEGERDRLLVGWNDTGGLFPVGRTIHDLVAERAVAGPDEPAVVCGDEVLTRREVNIRANRLARFLGDRGVGRGDLVGVFLDRGPELIISLLAIMKAGAAFVPLDTEYPAERLAFVLEDTAARLVISRAGLVERLPDQEACVLIDRDWPVVRSYSAVEPETVAGSDDLAYVIYTSGSTGKPKGVMIEHEGVVNYLHWCVQNYPPAGELGSLLYSSVAFDLTVTALFLPLLQGLPIAIPTPEPGETGFAAAVEQLLSGVSVSFLKMTPSHAELLVASAEASRATLAVRTIVLGGEELTADLARRILAVCEPDTVIFNEYGATECSVANVMSATCHVDDTATGGISLGGPITNTRAYIADSHDRLVPVGVTGECLLGGICVGRGYLNRSELTAERFVELDLGDGPQRLYRTGDLCKRLPTGELEFIGRIDTQVKLRGYRIELGEIEATLLNHPAVAAAAVTVREDTPGAQRLIGYLVPASDTDRLDPDDLKAHAARTLPNYMIPTGIVTLKTLPLTPNGKTDRTALPAPTTHNTHTSPQTPTQHHIATIWQNLLGTTNPSIHDNFFDHGGHSLLAIKLTTQLNREFGVNVPLRALFQAPTIAELSELLPRLHPADLGTIQQVRRSSSVPIPLSSAQRALWFLDQLEPGRNDYVVPIALRLVGELDVAVLEEALTQLVARHEVLRTRFAADDSGQPHQVIDPPAPVGVPVVDMVGQERSVVTARLDSVAAEPFDLTAGPLMRTVLMRTGPADATLVICLHHIIFDGWSETVFAEELRHCYAAAINDTTAELPELPIQYAHYAAWQQQQLATDQLRGQLDYWRGQLAGLRPVHLPTDRPRRAKRFGRGDAVAVTIPAATVTALRDVATDARASLFMAVLAGFQVMLSRYSGQDDIAVGTPIAGRGHAETDNLIGLFVNSLVLRTDLSGDPTYADLLGRVRDTALAAYDHQDLPFDRIVDELTPQRDLTRNPLYQTMVVLRTSTEDQSWQLSGVTVEPVPITGGLGKFDLNLTLGDTGDGGLAGHIDYPTDLFDTATVERMADHYRTLLQHLAGHPTTPLSGITMLTGTELEAVKAWEAETTIPAEIRGVPTTPTAVRVVDRHGQPVPVGVPGELILDGEQPRRTGDLVRWSPEGELRFLCQVEDIVTVHGDRVVLGEVDTVLAACPGVAEAATAVHDAELVGYVVSAGPVPPTTDELRQFLGERLPASMVPSAHVILPRLPRTTTGLVDRPSLPAPEPGPESAPTVASHNPTEHVITDIWRELLGVTEVRLTDNFFALGGDSIISLQVIARAKRFGIQLTPRMFFQHQTVAAIAANATSASSVLVDQTKIVGEVPLTPIQHWFFELNLPDPAHFNQVELLVTDGLDGAVLERALLALVEHHDVLRLRVERHGDQWRQYLDSDAGLGVLACHDLSGLGEDELWPRMNQIADAAQLGMNLAAGPVIRAALLELGARHGQRLLIAIHHLAVDGVSWRVLLEDLGTAYRQAAAGRVPVLPAKTTSMRSWAEKLVRYAHSPGALAEIGYWTEQRAGASLPRDHDGANTIRSGAALRVALSEQETSALLQEIPRAFHTQINDVLLASVGAAVHAWTGDDSVNISLEGHGREDLFSDVDTSRTVGWFTSVFPVGLHGMAQTDHAVRLKDVSAQLREVPRRGIGYGILRYLGDAATRQALAHRLPDVNFNYLGQFAAEVPGIGRYADTQEPRGRSIGAAGMRRHLLDILATVENGRLTIEISYSTAVHETSTIERFADDVTHNLRALLDVATEQNEGIGAGMTHVPLAELDGEDMAAIMKRFSA